MYSIPIRIFDTSKLDLIPEKECSCPKILIVDDNEINIFALNLMLNSLGDYSSDSALHGKEALEMVIAKEQKKPAIVSIQLFSWISTCQL